MEKANKLTNIKVNDDALTNAYNEALKDKDFKDLTSKLNLNISYLKQYTSLLEESCSEYKNCANCKGLVECKNKKEGFAYLPKVVNKELIFEYKPCKYELGKIKKDQELKTAKNFYAPVFLKEADIKKIYKTDKKRFAVINWLLDFKENYTKGSKGLYLSGNFGSGKTYLVSAIFNELAKKGYKSSVIFWPEFVKGMFNADFKEIVDYVKNVDLLLIDDLGAENLTAYNRDELLCPILQYRMDNNLSTFITSNLNLDDLHNHLSISKNGVEEIKAGRIISRIEQLTIPMELISKNLRK